MMRVRNKKRTSEILDDLLVSDGVDFFAKTVHVLAAQNDDFVGIGK
jgi:hypothetical protein